LSVLINQEEHCFKTEAACPCTV